MDKTTQAKLSRSLSEEKPGQGISESKQNYRLSHDNPRKDVGPA